MKILVAIKQVPDKNARLVLDSAGQGIVETDVTWEINESDRYALESALRIKEAGDPGGEVVAVTLGPERARKAISSALAMGADRAIHLVDPDFQNGDPLSVARVLAAVVRKEEPELVLCGTRSDDAGYGETPILLGGLLGWPAVFLTMGIEVAGGRVQVVRELEAARQELSTIALPAVLAVQSGIHEVRYTSLKGIMAAKKKAVDQLTPTELGLSREKIGRFGSRLQVLDLAPPVRKSKCEFIEGKPGEAAAALVDKLRRDAKVL
jgi:electron transfer flavoprotein beta subunit